MGMEIIIAGLLASLASILANQGVAVFNDGLRPIVPEYLEGRMDRKSLGMTSFALGFGLVVGFGIPFSLTSSIILIHSILLGTDIIGTMTPKSKIGVILAGVIGLLYGAGIVVGLDWIVALFSLLPVDFLPSLGKVGAPVVIAFAAFPALVVGYQYGFLRGALTLILTFLTRIIFAEYGSFIVKSREVVLNPEGMALIVGITIMLFFAIKEKGDGNTTTANLLGIFSQRVARVKKNIIPLALLGGLVAASTSANIVAGDPISLNLLNEGKVSEAGIAALARAIGFIPLVATTAITTGVYGPAGMTLVFAVGIFTGNPFLAFILGALTIALEILLLGVIAKTLDKFPGVKKCGDNIRTAMGKVLEVSLLVGSMIAANEIAPGVGYLFVAGLYTLNQTAKKPLANMAVGPVAVIGLGIILNILALFNIVAV